jgi:hypothetical protein
MKRLHAYIQLQKYLFKVCVPVYLFLRKELQDEIVIQLFHSCGSCELMISVMHDDTQVWQIFQPVVSEQLELTQMIPQCSHDKVAYEILIR